MPPRADVCLAQSLASLCTGSSRVILSVRLISRRLPLPAHTGSAWRAGISAPLPSGLVMMCTVRSRVEQCALTTSTVPLSRSLRNSVANGRVLPVILILRSLFTLQPLRPAGRQAHSFQAPEDGMTRATSTSTLSTAASPIIPCFCFTRCSRIIAGHLTLIFPKAAMTYQTWLMSCSGT